MNRAPLRLAFLLIPLALAWLALSPTAQAVVPAPDGGYPGNNTAEGTDALFSLTDGINNTAVGFDVLFNNTTGSYNTANGLNALFSNTTGSRNTAIGDSTLFGNTTGNQNTATGDLALFSNTTGIQNTATGDLALFFNTIGTNNTATGNSALVNNTTGSFNIALGDSAGSARTTGSNNIDIGNRGVAGESNHIRIGTRAVHTDTFIAGINGVTVPNGVGVVVNPQGHLGTVVSSARYKENIQPMDELSEVIHSLRPVTFRYKRELDPNGIPQFGLVAEEVEKVNPDLVARDDQGKPYSVRYEAVNAMLLNEFLKEHRKVSEQGSEIAELRATVTELKSALKEQTAELRKVSAQVASCQASARLVSNPN